MSADTPLVEVDSAKAEAIAVFAQYIALLGSVEDHIVDCFRHGGGVLYDRFGRFHEVMAEDSGQSVLSSLESHILPLVPGLTDRLADGIRVLDVGCGSGRIMNLLAKLYPRSQGHRTSNWNIPLHGLLHALHDRLARTRWRGPRRDVGRRKDALVSPASRLSVGYDNRLAHDTQNNWYVVTK